MKISVSLPRMDVELLDSYARSHAFASWSAAEPVVADGSRTS